MSQDNLAKVASVLFGHRDAIESTLRKALAPEPSIDCSVVIIQFREGDARIVVGDRAVIKLLADEFARPDATELNRLIGAELALLFEVPIADGIERCLVVDNETGVVARTRFASSVRRDLRLNRSRN